MDPVDVRRVNFVPSDAFPYTTATGLTYDSGDFHASFDRALELADYGAIRKAQRSASRGDMLTGVGVATVIKASGGKAGVRQSRARVEIDVSGRVSIFTDVSPHGQGTETSFAQIAAALPAMAESCLAHGRLQPGYLANLNGTHFTTDPSTPLSSGDTLLILSADVGG